MGTDNSLGFKGYLTIFLLTGLFFTAIISWEGDLAEEYDQTSKLNNDVRLKSSDISSELNETSEEANKWIESFSNDNIFVAAGEIVLFSTWGIFKLVGNSTISFFKLIFGVAVNVLGIDPLVIGVLSSLLIIGLIFAIWRVFKMGE